jgi:5-methylcytosine-specific restriction endonuclease McrA
MANGKRLLKDSEKPKTLSPSQWQKKCDTKIQQIGRKLFPYCEVCGKPMSCLHHYYPKSVSSRLRYDWDNLIPICNGCHMRHHRAGDPTVHNIVNEKRGKEWLQSLKSRKLEEVRTNVAYYKEVWESLKQYELETA